MKGLFGRQRASSRWGNAARIGGAFVILLMAITVWFVLAVLPGERLRMAMVEANRLCRKRCEAGGRMIGVGEMQSPVDPWKRPCRCLALPGGALGILTYGADGLTGGSGGNADVLCKDGSDRWPLAPVLLAIGRETHEPLAGEAE